MTPYRLSEGSSPRDNKLKHLEVLTGDNFNDLIPNSGKHWIVLIHEDHKSHQQVLHNLNEFVKSYGHIFSKLRFAVYNQLVNTSPIDVVGQVPLLAFMDRHKIYKLKTDGVNGIPLEVFRDSLDLYEMFSFLKANYPLKGELKKFVDFTGIEVDANPDDISNLEETDQDDDL